MEEFTNDQVLGVLLAIEVMWVAGFLAVFVIYFAIKWRIKKKRQTEAENKSSAHTAVKQPKTNETKDN